jgi:putative hemolysin
MDPDDLIASLLLICALLFLSAFFVAVEFALQTSRRRRSDTGVRDDPGRPGAPPVPADRAEEISLFVQLASLACLLLLGHYSVELAVSRFNLLHPDFAAAAGIAIAATLYLVLGQQVPRLLGAQRPQIANAIVLAPLRALSIVVSPILALVRILIDGFSRLLRLSRSGLYAPVHTLEEIREFVVQGHEQGVVEEDEREMIRGVFEFSATVAREVMTPRIDIIAVPKEITLDELIDLVVTEGHSRVPVFAGTIDNIIGVLLAKDLLPLMANPHSIRAENFDVSTLMREPYFVPDTKPVDDILAEFRQSSMHLAIVIDEFGGTYGLVTMEDLLEEIVGEIKDEYDIEEPEFSATPEGDILIDGGASISEVNERFGLELKDDDFDTIGGYIFGALGRVPITGDKLEVFGPDGMDFLEVEEAEERRVTRVRLRRAGNGAAPEI